MNYKKNSQYMSSARRKDWSHYKDEVVLNFIPQTHTYSLKYNLVLCDHANSSDVRGTGYKLIARMLECIRR